MAEPREFVVFARLLVFALCPIAIVLASPPVLAQPADPARIPVQALSDALIASMKGGARMGFAGRVQLLRPVVLNSFDLPLMTRLIIGPRWTTMSAADQAAVADAFARFTIAQYAGNFSSYAGQSFSIAAQVDNRGGDRLVRTSLLQPGKPAIPIAYRLRQSGGRWRIIDVFYNNSISQLATRRADFEKIMATGGARALVAHLETLIARAAK